MTILGIIGSSFKAIVAKAGYFGGGSNSGLSISGIDKITFPADTRTTLSATLSSARYFHAGMANSGTL